MKRCSVDGCSRPFDAKGYCTYHYYRWRKFGNPLHEPKTRLVSFLEELCEDPPEHCVIWPFGTSANGYGVIRFRRRQISAHRASLIIYTGEDPKGLDAAHGPCHNRACVNPLHISWKTVKENMADKARDGTSQAGERSGAAKLKAHEVIEIFRDQRRHWEIAADYGISRNNVGQIKKGVTWGHLTGGLT